MHRTGLAVPLLYSVVLSSGCASEETPAKTPAAPIIADLSAKADSQADATTDVSPEQARAEDLAPSENGRLAGLKGSALGDAAKRGAPESLPGDPIGDSFGDGGLGLADSGQSGGATGKGTIPSNMSALGRGGGTGAGLGLGSGRMGTPSGTHPKVSQGSVSVTGALSKEEVRRVVSRNLPRIAYCYERSLAQDPTLSGTVIAKFTINGSGAVIAVAFQGDLTNKDVVRCVERSFSVMTFPEPGKGALVQVSYPIKFTPADPEGG
jgi:hypothetical protein